MDINYHIAHADGCEALRRKYTFPTEINVEYVVFLLSSLKTPLHLRMDLMVKLIEKKKYDLLLVVDACRICYVASWLYYDEGIQMSPRVTRRLLFKGNTERQKPTTVSEVFVPRSFFFLIWVPNVLGLPLLDSPSCQ